MPCLITPMLLYYYFGKKWHGSVLQLLPQNALYIIIRTRDISQIGNSLGSVWTPAGRGAVHSGSAGHAGTEGSAEVQLGSPSPGIRVGPAVSAAGREHPHCPGSFSNRQGTCIHLYTCPWWWSPPAHLAEPWFLHGRALEGALPAAP